MGPCRLPPIPAAEYNDTQKQAASEFAAGRGYEVRGPFAVMLRSPEVMLRAKAMGDYLRFRTTLGPRLNEMAILITAHAWSQPYEWHAHKPHALKAGLSAGIVAAIEAGERPADMADDEATLYDFCTELHHSRQVSDATYARALRAFGEPGVIDLVGVNGYYTFLAMMLNVARTEVPASE